MLVFFLKTLPSQCSQDLLCFPYTKRKLQCIASIDCAYILKKAIFLCLFSHQYMIKLLSVKIQANLESTQIYTHPQTPALTDLGTYC